MRDARLGGLPRHPPRRARNPNSELFSKHALSRIWASSLAPVQAMSSHSLPREEADYK
jgi:hypothetical protein